MAVAFVRAAPPGPVAITAVTVVPLSLTELPFASWSWTTGCWANATPLCALPDGAVVSASFVATPAVPVAVNVTGLPVTATFATGFPFASFTITDGGGLTAVPAGADVPPAFAAIVAAGPAVPV